MRSMVAMARLEMPSDLPMKPSPSVVVALRFTESGCRPREVAIERLI